MQRKLDGSNGDNGLNRPSFSPIEASSSAEHVAILLSTYNGASFLARQLDSLLAQSHQNWTIYASDDGSSDLTLKILENYRQRLGADRLKIFSGPRLGFAQNFLSLLRRKSIQAPYFAFCDQDDVWHAEKLSNALSRLNAVLDPRPALYCSRTRLIDETGHPIGFSPLFLRSPSFENALVQSIAGGNTMVMNQTARQLLASTSVKASIISHDWWAYLLVSGCGGHVLYESCPQIDYRQHDANLMGSNRHLKHRIQRFFKMFDGTFRLWNSENLHALEPFENLLTTTNRERLNAFRKARSESALNRLAGFRKAGIYRQALLENLVLTVAALFNRI